MSLLNSLMLAAADPSATPENPLHFDWQYIKGNIPQALIAAALGLVMVFVILAILIGFICLMRFLLQAANRNKGGEPAANALPAPLPDEGRDPKVVAAITAALTAYYETQQPETGEEVTFVIRKIKRTR